MPDQIEKLTKELTELKNMLAPISEKIRETGGQNIRYWLFQMDGRVRDLEKKIDDLKTNKTRSDEMTPEYVSFEKRLVDLENSLEKGKTEK